MRPIERRSRIANLIRERGRVTVDALAHELGASFETIRRDLTELAARGLIRKFHGGAILLDALYEAPASDYVLVASRGHHVAVSSQETVP